MPIFALSYDVVQQIPEELMPAASSGKPPKFASPEAGYKVAKTSEFSRPAL
jgi:hypothetical protein